MTASWREPAGSSRRDARRLEADALSAAGEPLDDPFLRDELHGLAAGSTGQDLPAGPQHDTVDLRAELAAPRTPDVPDDAWAHSADGPAVDDPTSEPFQADPSGPGAPTDVERHQNAIAAEAVHLLSQAQLIADRCVEDAEQYARDLVMVARSQYREILQRAEELANATLADLPPVSDDPRVPYVPLPEIEYVRTYAQVARVQLRSVLDALTEQVDRLGSLPDLGVPRPDPVPLDLGDVNWDPDIDRAFR